MILPSYPFRVEIEATTACDIDCLYCYRDKSKHDSKPLESIKFILTKTKEEANPFELVFLGGEPFMRKDILDIIEFAESKSFTKIGVSTNGTLFDTQSQEQIMRLKSLVDRGLGLQISLDSTDHKINDLTRGMGESTLNGIKLLNDNSIRFGVGIVITRLNYSDIPRTVISLLLYENLVGVNLEVLQPTPFMEDTTYLALNVTPKEKIWLYEEISSLASGAGHKIAVTGIRPSITYPKDVEPLLHSYDFKTCTAGLLRGGILANGNVVPCVNLRDVVLGNLYKQSWRDIWSNAVERFTCLRREGPQCIQSNLLRSEEAISRKSRSAT